MGQLIGGTEDVGILIQKDNERSRLQERINADLRARSQVNSAKTDFTEDSEYTASLKKTGRFAWVWFLLVFLAVLSLVVILVI